MLVPAHFIFTALVVSTAAESFDPLQHLGGNSPWFSGPNVNNISPDAPQGCRVDQAAFTSRHGSRYPDPGAYNGWVTLAAKIQNATFTVKDRDLDFLKTWQPVLTNPAAQLSQVSQGGYKELYDMGVQYRWNYPSFYKENTPYVLWANRYQETGYRVVDSARLFARGYLGPNATDLGRVYVLNNTDPRSIANSLAPSDLCPLYNDTSGGINATTWAEIYLPPIVTRINGLLSGLNFTASDITTFATLCGFETQITGRTSPWCDVLKKHEIEQYEYAQDIRYYYGTGPGTDIEQQLMLPFLVALVQRFVDGPNATYVNANGTSPFTPNPLIATFTNDGQISQLAAALGIYDDQKPLSATRIDKNRIYISSTFVTLRGTIGFERLNCGSKGLYMRIKLNDQVYPVAGCQGGPGKSCSLSKYQALVAKKNAAFGGFVNACGIANSSLVPAGQDKTTFLTNLGLPFEYVFRP
ncbi:hypothetical protein LTR95_016123 [Oleoguttula sp. CCFEE 5521]